jgi:hypothetical protein
LTGESLIDFGRDTTWPGNVDMALFRKKEHRQPAPMDMRCKQARSWSRRRRLSIGNLRNEPIVFHEASAGRQDQLPIALVVLEGYRKGA